MTLRRALHAVDADSAIGHNRKRQKKLMKAAKANKALPMKGGGVPVGGEYPLTCLGVTSEAFADALGEYVRSNPDSSLKSEPLPLTSRVHLCRITLLGKPLLSIFASCQNLSILYFSVVVQRDSSF